MRSLFKLTPGLSCIVLVAIVVGLGHNALRPDSLPLVRKPLRETRAFADSGQMLAGPPAPMEAAEVSARPGKVTSPRPSVSTVAKVTQVNPNALKPHPFVSEEQPKQVVRAVQPKSGKSAPAQALFTTLEDAKACLDSGKALFVDARTYEDYEAEHIPGAVSLYHGALDKLYKQVLGAVPKDRLIIVYCSDPECKEATELADRLVAREHSKVYILLEGLPGWVDAGYETIRQEEKVGG